MPRSPKRALPGPSFTSRRSRPSPIPEDEPRCPILDHRDQLLATITECDLTVVIGSPGQGKSAQLPRLLLQAGLADSGPIAVVHVSAASAAFSAGQVERSLGDAVGLKTRFELRGRPSRTRLRFITDGCLLREMLDDSKVLDRHPILLLDDVHLRRWQTDLLLFFIRDFVKRRKQQQKTLPKLILMGSLMDSSHLLAYFPMLKSRVVFVSSPIAPENDLQCKDLTLSLPVSHVAIAVQAVEVLLKSHPRGDILCFLASHYETMNACFLARTMLAIEAASSARPASLKPLVMSLYEGMPRKELQKVVAPAPEGYRKVIFSDSFAENSMKIHGIGLVVDSGYCREKYNPGLYTIPGLSYQEICSAHAWYRQQRARATGRGILYRLYTHEEPPPTESIFVEPELEQSTLAPLVLFALKLKCEIDGSSFANIEFLPEEQFDAAFYELKLLGAITEEGEQRTLTRIGDLMVQLPLDVPLARAVVAAAELGCSAELLTISAMLNAGPIFHDFGRSGERFKNIRRRFATEYGDPVSLLMIYRAYRSAAARGDKRFCRRHCLNVDSLRRALVFRRRLRRVCLRLGLPVRSCGANLNLISTAITTGYLLGTARHSGAEFNGNLCHEYASALNGVLMLACDTALFATAPPQFLVHLESERRCGWEISKACVADKALVLQLCPKLLGRSVGQPGRAEDGSDQEVERPGL